MLKICKLDKNKVIKQINNKVLDAIITSNSNLIDDIILSMHHEKILDCLDCTFYDNGKHNSIVPFSFIMALAIASKIKTKMSLTDNPYAITDCRTLAELGYTTINTDGSDGWLSEETIRFLIGKYEYKELFNYYNQTVQNYILKERNIKPNIHILDCTNIRVNLTNQNDESSTIGRNHQPFKDYKLSSLRGVVGDTGIIEEVHFGKANIHDLELSEEMIKNTDCFHDGDILIMNKGFISRELINHLKTIRNVDVYIPVKKNMEVYDLAVSIAESTEDWQNHPTRDNQMIFQVNHMGIYWRSSDIKNDVDLNACVVWFEEMQNYDVLVTTDITKSDKDIIRTYQMCSEIEEDFRQLKDFLNVEDFKSTKLNVISFHIVCVLFGYLFYQLYLTTKDGKKSIGKPIPLITKYQEVFLNNLVLFSGEYFCMMSLREFIEFRDKCSDDIKEYLLNFFK